MTRNRLILYFIILGSVFLIRYIFNIETSFTSSNTSTLSYFSSTSSSSLVSSSSTYPKDSTTGYLHGATTTITSCNCPEPKPCPELSSGSTTGSDSSPIAPIIFPEETLDIPEESITNKFDTRINALIQLFLEDDIMLKLLTEQPATPSNEQQRYQYFSDSLSRLTLLSAQIQEIIKTIKQNISHVQHIDTVDTDTNAIIYPDPTTIRCHAQQDSFDLCHYENICIDIPSDKINFNSNLEPSWYLIQSYLFPSSTTTKDIPSMTHIRSSPLGSFSSSSAEETTTIDPITKATKEWLTSQLHNRHAQRQESFPGVSLEQLEKDGLTDRLAWDFVDVLSPHPGKRPRAVPFGTFFRPKIINANDAIPKMSGGNFPGIVTWIDNVYISYSLLHSQLWGFSQGVAFPMLGSIFANESSNLHLPPIDNFVVIPDRWRTSDHSATAWNQGNPYQGYKGGTWINGILTETLQYFHPRKKAPYSGFTIDPHPIINYTQLPESANGYFPYENYIIEIMEPVMYTACQNFDTILQPYMGEGNFGGVGGLQLDSTNSYNLIAICLMRFAERLPPFNTNESLPILPYQTLSMDNIQDGTRMMFTPRDIPPHPLIVSILFAFEELAAPLVQKDSSVPLSLKMIRSTIHQTVAYQKLYEHMLRYVPHRICGKRAVLLGNRDALVGGNAEATFIRNFAHDKGTTPILDRGYTYPPQQILIVDRGDDDKGKHNGYGRWFANRDEMEIIIQKYNVTYRVLTDREIFNLTFIEQMKIFGQYGLLIMAHGAGESTSAFMPPRSAVIEIYPYGMWCPVFLRMHTASGNHHFSIHSELKGTNLDYAYVNGLRGPRGGEKHLELAQKIEKQCEHLGHVGSSLAPDCWHDNRMSNVMVPLAEFEHTLLLALHSIGIQRYPINSPISLLHGAPNGTFYTDSPLSQLDPEYYRSRRWKVCPPNTTY